jgi:tetratricopeptide (TPR) repeat protein
MHLKKEPMEAAKLGASRIRALIENGNALAALEEARKLLQVDDHDMNICHVVSSLLIDSGAELDDPVAIGDGMALVERLLAANQENSHFRTKSIYNLSNAHAALYQYHRAKRENSSAFAALQSQKSLLQELLLRKEFIPRNLLPEIFTNYANCLDHLNRTFEAIDYYQSCITISQHHGVAKGNCALALHRIPSWTSQHHLENYLASWDLLSSALQEPASVTDHANPSALDHLKKDEERLRESIIHRFKEGVSTLEAFRLHRAEAHSEPIPNWLKLIVNDRLILSFNQLPWRTKHDALDDAFLDSLSFGTSAEAERRSINLLHLLNSIKEEFASARYLYYHATRRSRGMKQRELVTTYANPEHTAVFGISAGVLKLSFRGAVDLLDKIALFIGLYFRLAAPRTQFNINNVWFENRDTKKRIIDPLLEPSLERNYPLIGLRDFQRDFFLQEYPAKLKNTRNIAAHRWITLRRLSVSDDALDNSWTVDDFSDLTLFILRQAKDAILLLVAAINTEERRRARESPTRRLVKPLSVGSPKIPVKHKPQWRDKGQRKGGN